MTLASSEADPRHNYGLFVPGGASVRITMPEVRGLTVEELLQILQSRFAVCTLMPNAVNHTLEQSLQSVIDEIAKRFPRIET